MHTICDGLREEADPWRLTAGTGARGVPPGRRGPARCQLVSAAGRRSRAVTVTSAGRPIVSNGAAVRFTQAVRIPAAPAPTQSNALLVTSRTWPTGTDSRLAACR